MKDGSGFDRHVEVTIRLAPTDLDVIASHIRNYKAVRINWYGVQIVFEREDAPMNTKGSDFSLFRSTQDDAINQVVLEMKSLLNQVNNEASTYRSCIVDWANRICNYMSQNKDLFVSEKIETEDKKVPLNVDIYSAAILALDEYYAENEEGLTLRVWLKDRADLNKSIVLSLSSFIDTIEKEISLSNKNSCGCEKNNDTKGVDSWRGYTAALQWVLSIVNRGIPGSVIKIN